jgi:ABC-type Fe3+/spermidine/putrescine transport system ATPase subunit
MEPGPAKLVIRPERIHLEPTTDPSAAIPVTVERTVYLGAMTDLVVSLPSGQSLVVRVASERAQGFERDDRLTVHIRPRAMRIVPPGGS